MWSELRFLNPGKLCIWNQGNRGADVVCGIEFEICPPASVICACFMLSSGPGSTPGLIWVVLLMVFDMSEEWSDV